MTGEVVPIRWTDPSTLQTFLVDPHTGNSWRPGFTVEDPCGSAHDHTAENDAEQQSFRRNGLVDKSSLKRKTAADDDVPVEQTPSWMVDSLAVSLLLLNWRIRT